MPAEELLNKHGDKLILAVDLAATVFLGSEGTLTAIGADIDLFGVMVLAFSTSLGGGSKNGQRFEPLELAETDGALETARSECPRSQFSVTYFETMPCQRLLSSTCKIAAFIGLRSGLPGGNARATKSWRREKRKTTILSANVVLA